MFKAYEPCTRARSAWLISLTLTAAACSTTDMPTQPSAPLAGNSSMTTSPSTMTAPAATASGSAGMKATTAAGSATMTMTMAMAMAAASGGAGAKAAAGSGTATASSAGTMAAASAGMSGSAGGAAAASDPTFTAVYNALFSNSAAAGCYGCHSGMMNPALNGNFSMITDKAAAYKGLVDGKSSPEGMCKNMTRVTAGDPMKSLLYLKISGAPPCGMKMPPGGTPLPADVVTLVKDWIMAGAKDD